MKDSNAYTLYFDEYGFIKYYHVTAPAATEYTYTYIVEGTLEEHEHGYTYEADGTQLIFLVQDGTIVSIEYRMAM